jgi:6-phosphogluconolactonase
MPPFPQSPKPPAKATLVFAGTSAQGKGKGIWAFWLQTDNLEVSQNITLAPLGLAAETPSPSYFEVDHKRRLLFAVNALNQFEGKQSGAVSAFSIDSAAGKLTLINQQPSMGTGPCHVALDKDGRNVLVANYNSGSVAVLPVAADGRLSEASSVIQHAGKSVHPQRQTGPHAHCVTLDAANRFAFVCDLGLDRVMSYRFDPQAGKITPNDPPFAQVKPGSGPRHLAFRPDGRFAYVINELTSTVLVFAYDPQAGKLTETQSLSSLPEYYDGPNTGAEISVHPSGKWVYASNRGNNTVVLFNVDAAKGTLTYVEEQGTGGKTPRHFGIEPSAKHLAIANQDSDQLLACRIDAGNGRLKPSGVFAECPSPTCVQFLPPA